MDFDDVLSQLQIGNFGRYQKLIFLLVLFPATWPYSFLGWGNQIFMSGTPSEYHCRLPGNLSQSTVLRWLPKTMENGKAVTDKCHMFDVDYTDNSLVKKEPSANAKIVPCKHGWIYSKNYWRSTIVMEFDLVCDKAIYVSHAYTLHAAGSLSSLLFVGYVADRHGRAFAYFGCYLTVVVSSIAAAFAPTFTWFVAARFITGIGLEWTFMLPVMTAMEIIGPKPRALISVIVALYGTAGLVMVGALSYFVRSWRSYALLTSLPLLLLLVAFLWFPESPRWILSEKRYTELAHMLEDIVEVNGKGPLDEENAAKLPWILKKINEDSVRNVDRRVSVWDLFRTRNLRKKTLILTFIGISNLGFHSGLTLYGPSIDILNPHFTFVISSLAELPGYFITTPMCNKLGRRLSLVLTMTFSGLAGVVAAGVPKSSVVALIVLIFVCKLTVSIAFVISELLEDEIFPTVVRGEGRSVTTFGQQFFSLGVPYVVYLGVFDYSVLPLIAFGVLSLLAATAALFLPETANTDLPQTLEDGERIGKNASWGDILHFEVPSYQHDRGGRGSQFEAIDEASTNQLPRGFSSQMWIAYARESLSRERLGGAT